LGAYAAVRVAIPTARPVSTRRDALLLSTSVSANPASSRGPLSTDLIVTKEASGLVGIIVAKRLPWLRGTLISSKPTPVILIQVLGRREEGGGRASDVEISSDELL